MNKKKFFTIAFSILSLLKYDKVWALEAENIENISLKSFPNHYDFQTKFYEYLLKFDINADKYEEYLRKNQHYNNSVFEEWESVETSSIFLEKVLMKSQDIKQCYNKIQDKYVLESEVEQKFKQSLLGSLSYVLQEYKQIIQGNMNEIYKSIFLMEPTDTVEYWLRDEDTFKMASYAGYFNGELTKTQQDLIESGKGYKLFNISDEELNEYLKYIQLRREIGKLEARYYLSIETFEGIQKKVLEKYKLNIYEQLTDEERLFIRESSLNKILFDEEQAYNLVIKMLQMKSLLKDNDYSPPINPGSNIGSDESVQNPFFELEEYLNNKEQIIDVTKNKLKLLYMTEKIKVLSGLKDTYICYKYKGKTYNTYIRPDQSGVLSKQVIDMIIKHMGDNLELKNVRSKDEMLILLDDTIKRIEFICDESIKFSAFKESFKKLGIEIYEEDIYKVNEINKQTSKYYTSDEYDNYALMIDLNDKSLIVPSQKDGSFYLPYLSSLLDSLEIKHVIGMDTLLVLNDNELNYIEIGKNEFDLVYKESVIHMFEKLNIKGVVKVLNVDKNIVYIE